VVHHFLIYTDLFFFSELRGLNCEPSDPDDPHLTITSTSKPPQAAFNFSLKNYFIEIGFLMSLLLSVTNKQSTVSTV
jgi:hypothetical protein